MDKNDICELVVNYGEYLEEEVFTPETTGQIFTADAHVLFAVGGEGTGIPELIHKHHEMMGPFTAATHNITNVCVTMINDSTADIRFHLEVIHIFRPEIAEKLPGNLFIVNDRIHAQSSKTDAGWRFSELEMNTVFKRIAKSVE